MIRLRKDENIRVGLTDEYNSIFFFSTGAYAVTGIVLLLKPPTEELKATKLLCCCSVAALNKAAVDDGAW
jgi:hypothetical protein